MIAVDRLLDTNFLISRWREGRSSPAAKWLRDNADLAVGLPWIVKGEFLRGAAVAGHQPGAVRAFLDRFPAIWPDNTTLDIYASQFARLRATNSLPTPLSPSISTGKGDPAARSTTCRTSCMAWLSPTSSGISAAILGVRERSETS